MIGKIISVTALVACLSASMANATEGEFVAPNIWNESSTAYQVPSEGLILLSTRTVNDKAPLIPVAMRMSSLAKCKRAGYLAGYYRGEEEGWHRGYQQGNFPRPKFRHPGDFVRKCRLVYLKAERKGWMDGARAGQTGGFREGKFERERRFEQYKRDFWGE